MLEATNPAVATSGDLAAAAQVLCTSFASGCPSHSPQDLTTMPRFIDLSHTVEHGMVTYKGLPAPIICDYLGREASRARSAPGTEFQIGKIEMVANPGTYIDSPFHRYPDGTDLAGLPLTSLANPASSQCPRR